MYVVYLHPVVFYRWFVDVVVRENRVSAARVGLIVVRKDNFIPATVYIRDTL